MSSTPTLEKTLAELAGIHELSLEAEIQIREQWLATAPVPPETPRPTYHEPLPIFGIAIPLFFMGLIPGMLLGFTVMEYNDILALAIMLGAPFVIGIGLPLAIVEVVARKRQIQFNYRMRKSGWRQYDQDYRDWFVNTSGVIQFLALADNENIILRAALSDAREKLRIY